MSIQDRYFSSGDYRYAYNGMETDNEVSGFGNSYTTEFRQYDPRLGRWKSLDPLMAKFPWMSPYVAFNDNPIFFVDPYGLSPLNDTGDDPLQPNNAPANPNLGDTYMEDGYFWEFVEGPSEGDDPSWARIQRAFEPVEASPHNKNNYNQAREEVKITGDTDKFSENYKRFGWDEFDPATKKINKMDHMLLRAGWGDPKADIINNTKDAIALGLSGGGSALLKFSMSPVKAYLTSGCIVGTSNAATNFVSQIATRDIENVDWMSTGIAFGVGFIKTKSGTQFGTNLLTVTSATVGGYLDAQFDYSMNNGWSIYGYNKSTSLFLSDFGFGTIGNLGGISLGNEVYNNNFGAKFIFSAPPSFGASYLNYEFNKIIQR